MKDRHFIFVPKIAHCSHIWYVTQYIFIYKKLGCHKLQKTSSRQTPDNETDITMMLICLGWLEFERCFSAGCLSRWLKVCEKTKSTSSLKLGRSAVAFLWIIDMLGIARVFPGYRITLLLCVRHSKLVCDDVMIHCMSRALPWLHWRHVARDVTMRAW